MSKRALAIASFVGAITVLSLSPASATAFYAYTGPTADMATDNSYVINFSASPGVGDVAFTLNGYASLDGANTYEDDFSLALNGSNILLATFNLGGGGTDIIYNNPNGGSATNISGNGTAITWAGGNVLVDIPVLLLGSNTLTFSYTSLSGPGFAGFQGLGDEGWGLENVSVTDNGRIGTQGTTVPEPLTLALFGAGFAGAAELRRRRKDPA